MIPARSNNRSRVTRRWLTRKWRRAALAAVLAAAGLTAGVTTAVLAGGTAHAAASQPNGNVSVNLFEWNWNSVATECTDHLGPAGVGSVQVAPPEESVDLPAADVSSGTAHPWWEVYQPVSYHLTSRMGDRAQFAAMVTACHDAGVAVIADAVLNHMAGDNNTATTGYGGCTFSPGGYSYPCVPYGYGDFHHYQDGCPTSDDQIDDWNDPTQVWNCELVHLSDLATGTSYVRTEEAGYLNTLISLGVDGFRLDAAKSIPPADIAAIEAMLNKTTWQGATPYIEQEVMPGSSSTELQYGNYEGTGSVINFSYAYDLKSAVDGGDLAALPGDISSLPPSGKSLDIVTNQDTARNGSTLTYKNGTAFTLANYFMLAYGYGVPQMYDSFTWSSYDQSPPSAANGMISAASCGAAWTCLHRQTGITGLTGWHNAVSGTPVANWTTTSNAVIAFSRGAKGWIGLNDTGSPVTATYSAGLPGGAYCDVVTGGVTSGGGSCAGTEVTVSSGQATVTIPAMSAVAIDVDATTSGVPVTSPSPTSSATPSPSPSGSASPSPSSSPTPAGPGTVPVTFDEYATTSLGTSVYISGDVPALGNWSTAATPSRELSASGYPVWTVTVNLPADSTIAYKYQEIGSSGNVTWETNPNRTITTGTSAMTVDNSWDLADADATDVTFNVTASTTYGTNVYVTGSIPALGDWNPVNAIPLSSSGYPVWSRLVMVPENTTFQYKYIEKDASGNVTWESGSNKSFTTGSGTGYRTSDTW